MTRVAVRDESEISNTTATAPRKRLNVKGKKPSRRLLVESVLGLAVIALAIVSFMLYNENNDLNSQIAKINDNPQIAVEQQTTDLLKTVGSLMQLPEGETPTIAGVSDAEKAKQQSAFFANAQNGDKVLMYVKAGQAILYRPETNRIILVAPLTFSNPAGSTEQSSTSTKKSEE